jgi:hypothetical protein
MAAYLYGECGTVTLSPTDDERATRNAAAISRAGDGEVCVTFEVFIGLAGAAACEALGLQRPFRGAEDDLERICEVVPDDARRRVLYESVLAFFRSKDGSCMLKRVARALERKRELSGAEVRSVLEGVAS